MQIEIRVNDALRSDGTRGEPFVTIDNPWSGTGFFSLCLSLPSWKLRQIAEELEAAEKVYAASKEKAGAA